MVREEEIGKTYTVTHNGLRFTATISQDPSQYEFYNLLGLDVFEKTEEEEIKELLDEFGISYRSNAKLETLKKKLDDYLTESDNKSKSDTDTQGEYNAE
jgi:transposase